MDVAAADRYVVGRRQTLVVGRGTHGVGLVDVAHRGVVGEHVLNMPETTWLMT